MNSGQAKRFLARKGATFAPGKGGHLLVTLNGRRAVLPQPGGSKEIGKRPLAGDFEATRHQGRMMRFAVNFAPDDNGTILVTVPDIPEALTFGEDEEDAMARAADAIETALIGAIEARDPIPQPRTPGARSVALPILSVAKIGLYEAMRADGVGKAELARRLGVALPQIDRLLDLRHHSRMDAVERALAAVGRSLSLTVEAA